MTDVHIDNLSVTHGGQRYFLQTSPEYAMKRLLAAGSGAIYQICPAFRGGEVGRRHNIEFTLLEWYRPGFDLEELMREVEALILAVAAGFHAAPGDFEYHRYKDLFERRFGCNPHELDLERLRGLALNDVEIDAAHLTGKPADRNDYLDLLFSDGIEPALTGAAMVKDFPAGQAALARVSADAEGCQVADRFELFMGGMEIANGYFELTDEDELRRRFENDNAGRRERGLPTIPLDEKLLAATGAMPSCSGVALGMDRLLMFLTGKEHLDEVIAFGDGRL